jgi:L-alanine-DL-glutamate epimerase-like enolase superfamily enzyme
MSDVRIRSVQARTVVVPMRRQVSFSTRAVPARGYTLVRVECTDDSFGLGFVQHGGSRFTTIPSDAVRGLFAPLLAGDDPHRTEGIWADLYQDALHSGRHGSVMRALSAVDIALWDRNARAAGLPLWRYLGAAARETVPAYASGGYYYRDGTLDDLVAEVRANVDRGYRAFKMKVGGASALDDAERIRLVREVIGEGLPLLLDANNRWKDDLPAAIRALRLWERHDPYWIEEPFGVEDVENHARLRRMTAVPVATGEVLGGRWAFQALLRAEAASVLNPDAGVCGGVTEYRRIAAMAAGFGVPVAPHSLEDVHVHLAAATPGTLFVEMFPEDSLHPLRAVVEGSLELTDDGEIRLPTVPGLGISFVDDAVEQYAIDAWS